MSLTDSDYVRFCRDGHPEMFRHLVSRYQTPLIKHLSSRLRDENEAAEAAQEAMVRAYSALPKLKKTESFFSWLLGIADRVAGEMHRVRRRPVASLDLDSVVGPSNVARDPEGCSSEQLTRAIAELPEAYREVILLRFYGGQSCSEICTNLGISLGTVTSRLSRAYVLLRNALHKLYQENRP